jgi:Zn ribbon nucleic-acid-binding protein
MGALKQNEIDSEQELCPRCQEHRLMYVEVKYHHQEGIFMREQCLGCGHITGNTKQKKIKKKSNNAG